MLRPIAVVGLQVPRELSEDDILGNFKLSQDDLALYKSMMTDDERKMHAMVEFYYREMQAKVRGNHEEMDQYEADICEEEPWPTEDEIIIIDE
jgi:hypothetical protein